MIPSAPEEGLNKNESQFDDKELFDQYGGAHNTRIAEIEYNENRAKDYAVYGKQWVAAKKEIMNTPIEKLKKNRDYQEIIDRNLKNDR